MVRAEYKTDISPAIRQFTETALEITWRRLVGTPTEFMVVYSDTLSNRCDSAEYNPDTDTILFAMERIKEQFGDLQIEAKMVLIAAHEATHRAQFARGENPRPSRRNWNYDDDRHEDEAWRVALDVFKEIYPNSYGGFDCSGKHYDLATVGAIQD